MANIVPISPSAYSGGAVSLNPAPYVNYYLQAQAHKQAQEEAMIKYFGDLQKNLTPAGMDSQDIKGLSDRMNQWKQFMIQNRDRISRPIQDQGKAYSEAMGRYNDMQNYIEQSKNKVKRLSTLQPILRNPQRNSLLTDQTFADIHRGSLPIDHPEYKEFDPSSVDFTPPKWGALDESKLSTGVNRIKLTETGTTRKDLGNRQQEVTHHYGFDPKDLASLQAQAASQYYSNPSFKGHIDALDDENGEAYHRLNDVYKNHFGKDIENKSDFATAYLLSLHQGAKNRIETRTIPLNPYQQSAITLDREKQFYDYRQQQNQIDEDQAEKFLTEREQTALKNPQYGEYIHNGKKDIYHVINLTPDQKAKIFSQKDVSGKHTLVPDDVAKFNNGGYLPIHYERDESGNIKVGPDGKKVVDADYTKPVDRDAVKASIIANRIVPKKVTTQKTTTTTHTKQNFGAGGLN